MPVRDGFRALLRAASLKHVNPGMVPENLTGFRALLRAASLKRSLWRLLGPLNPRFPRASARGLIEATNSRNMRPRWM